MPQTFLRQSRFPAKTMNNPGVGRLYLLFQLQQLTHSLYQMNDQRLVKLHRQPRLIFKNLYLHSHRSIGQFIQSGFPYGKNLRMPG